MVENGNNEPQPELSHQLRKYLAHMCPQPRYPIQIDRPRLPLLLLVCFCVCGFVGIGSGVSRNVFIVDLCSSFISFGNINVPHNDLQALKLKVIQQRLILVVLSRLVDVKMYLFMLRH